MVTKLIRNISAWAWLIVGSLVFSACGGEHSGETHHHDYHNIQERIEAESLDTAEYGIDNLDLVDVEVFKVALEGKEFNEFYVEARQPQMLHYACSECHNKPLEELKLEVLPGEKKAHWDVHILHASSATMKCGTCHNSENLDELRTIEGAKLNFNESYKLCGQCHSSQLNDWIGGAHGKRLGGWTKPRVVKSCASCHNPHNPAIKPRWPARLNTKQILEEQQLESAE